MTDRLPTEPLRIFIAGASGVIGIRIVPLLVEAGHIVAGLTRTVSKAARLRDLGAEPVICDVFDPDALRDALVSFAPTVVLHELTDLPDVLDDVPGRGGPNARIRRVGTHNLLTATAAAGQARVLAQSIAWKLPGDGGAAVDEMEAMVLGAGGVVLRYGQFYGPGTYHQAEPPPPPRIHVDTAAHETVRALNARTGVLDLVEAVTTAAPPG